jgi:UDP-N-acetylmuramate--alanine ligase
MESLPNSLQDISIFMVGIKGTGMAAFAEILQRSGSIVSGSDTEEKFFTDEVLKSAGIPFCEGFRPENIRNPDFVVHSAAYDRNLHPELLEAKRKNIPILSYSEALGSYSAGRFSCAVSGVHGKTTTTAICATVIKTLGLSGGALVGSAVPSLDGRATWSGGDDFFIAETCEYRRHFLAFHPSAMILTSVELDHQDYFRDYEDIQGAFIEFALTMPPDGTLIWCADEKGAAQTAGLILKKRPDLVSLPYGFSAAGDFQVTDCKQSCGESVFSLAGFPGSKFRIRIPGLHNVLNCAAASAMCRLVSRRGGINDMDFARGLEKGLYGFLGSKRRSEIVGEAGGITFIDDYGHHPTAVKKTIEGLKEFYPGRRIVLDFMSHTYSRTAALLSEFADSVLAADAVILHKIYASAREKYDGTVRGRDLYELAKAKKEDVYYFEEVLDAAGFCLDFLKESDVFVTMGAGDNWRLGVHLLRQLEKRA